LAKRLQARIERTKAYVKPDKFQDRVQAIQENMNKATDTASRLRNAVQAIRK